MVGGRYVGIQALKKKLACACIHIKITLNITYAYIMTRSKFNSMPILMQLLTFCSYHVAEATELQPSPLVQ